MKKRLGRFTLFAIVVVALTQACMAQGNPQHTLEGGVDTILKNAGTIVRLKETDDCSVRAISEAYDMPYISARLLLSMSGRQHREGVSLAIIMKTISDYFPYTATGPIWMGRQMSSFDFVRQVVASGHSYLVLAPNHIFVIEEGEFCQWLFKGNSDDWKKGIFAYIEIKN
jgi:hypothetical protein